MSAMNQTLSNKERSTEAIPVLVASLLFYVSGSAALVYEVLWMKELSLLFGNSAQAAAATLAAFFTGIAAGNAYWGKRASSLQRPLLAYGVLELCVTLSAVLFFALFFGYDALYPALFLFLEQSPWVFVSAKFLLALALFFPAAFFMGGTFPVMTEYLVRHKDTLGKRASALYAVNTIGAATGALAAGFYLPQALGINNSYALAMGMTLLVACIAIVLGRDSIPISHQSSQNSVGIDSSLTGRSDWNTLIGLATLSGFISLSLQVLWIRMFAQVLHNSVYSYSAILAIFLVALAIGGAIARIAINHRLSPQWFVPALLTLTAALVAASPLMFHTLTDAGSYIGGNQGFLGYLIAILKLTAIVIGIPTLVIGFLLPYLFKLAEVEHFSPGESVGRLVTVNTLGAIIGSVVAGFILLEWFGLWQSIHLMALLYLIAGFLLTLRNWPDYRVVVAIPLAGFALLFTALDSRDLPVVKLSAAGEQETLLDVWEGSDATVAVIRRNGHLRTKLNNWYTLGSTGDMTTQQIQTHLPILLHPRPEHVFYLGLGTGITAGTAMNYPVKEVTIAEIAPSAIRASQQYFGEFTNGLFDDERVHVIAEDGRNVLRGTSDTYDLIISDLFIPWKAGTGTLYSVEHYRAATDRLKSGGMYAQWLPLYQLTQEEFRIIARSMLAAFPSVSMWRGNFWGNRAVVALIGHKESADLSSGVNLMDVSKQALNENVDTRGDTVPLIAHYLGSLTQADVRLSSAPFNTDDRPIIEYLAPINHRKEKAGDAEWFIGRPMFEFVASGLSADALRTDPYLAGLNPLWHDVIRAGYALHASFLYRDQGSDKAATAKANFHTLMQRAARAGAAQRRDKPQEVQP